MSQGQVVAVVGSRILPSGGPALVGQVCGALVGAGRSLVVGCCQGADQAAFSSVPVGSISVLCAFGPGGQGAGPASAVSAVSDFVATGGSVTWWAGGPASVPLSARLVARTQAVVSTASSGLVVFFGSPSSRGSMLGAQSAVARGLPVVAFPLGFPGSQLSSLGAGQWQPLSSGIWGKGWQWVPLQCYLF